MTQEQTRSPSSFQQAPEPAAFVPAVGETQEVCVSPRESEPIDAAVLGYN
ncbi:MAG TPA: hypothetical protein VFW68_14245 [Rhodocyclaceae bacterium]|nr:hypothetical protein [Rhodocyclaceae bacterium]